VDVVLATVGGSVGVSRKASGVDDV